MHFRVEVPFQIESTAKFDVSNKNTYFKGFHKFTLINFSCSFRTTYLSSTLCLTIQFKKIHSAQNKQLYGPKL